MKYNNTNVINSSAPASAQSERLFFFPTISSSAGKPRYCQFFVLNPKKNDFNTQRRAAVLLRVSLHGVSGERHNNNNNNNNNNNKDDDKTRCPFRTFFGCCCCCCCCSSIVYIYDYWRCVCVERDRTAKVSFTAVLFTDDTAKQQHETGQSYKDTVAFCFSLSLSLSLSPYRYDNS